MRVHVDPARQHERSRASISRRRGRPPADGGDAAVVDSDVARAARAPVPSMMVPLG
jgi:hypothetical protein